jgi:hypothetical protein
MTSHEQRYCLGSVTVSRIGFGAMQLPGPGVFGSPRDLRRWPARVWVGSHLACHWLSGRFRWLSWPDGACPRRSQEP